MKYKKTRIPDEYFKDFVPGHADPCGCDGKLGIVKTKSNVKRVLICILLLIAVLVVLFGCTRIQYVPVKELQFERIELRDTIVKTVLIPYTDTVYLYRDTVSYLHNQYAESWARWIEGGLSHSLRIFPDSIPVKVQIKEVERVKEIEIPIEVERRLSKWEAFKMDFGGWAFGALCGIVIIGIVYILRRKV